MQKLKDKLVAHKRKSKKEAQAFQELNTSALYMALAEATRKRWEQGCMVGVASSAAASSSGASSSTDEDGDEAAGDEAAAPAAAAPATTVVDLTSPDDAAADDEAAAGAPKEMEGALPTQYDVTHNQVASRFEINLTGADGKPQLAVAEYQRCGVGEHPGGAASAAAAASSVGAGGLQVLDLYHTEVPPADRGKGIADQLLAGVFRHAQEVGVAVRPSCSYVSETWLPRHPEYNAMCEVVAAAEEAAGEVAAGPAADDAAAGPAADDAAADDAAAGEVVSRSIAGPDRSQVCLQAVKWSPSMSTRRTVFECTCLTTHCTHLLASSS
jgi:predicted GNAT family acetyltransferase